MTESQENQQNRFILFCVWHTAVEERKQTRHIKISNGIREAFYITYVN